MNYNLKYIEPLYRYSDIYKVKWTVSNNSIDFCIRELKIHIVDNLITKRMNIMKPQRYLLNEL